MSNKCVRCHMADKARGASKYCSDCRIIEQRETNRVTQQIRRQKNYTPCAECNKVMSYTKYCTRCAKIVLKRNNNGSYQREKEKNKMCEECFVKPKWSQTGTTKYCEECKVIVQKRKIEEKNKLRDAGKAKVRKPRKQPIHKGITLDPTAQKPTKKVPKMVTKDGGINPYFLRRGDPQRNGGSSGMTPFNQV